MKKSSLTKIYGTGYSPGASMESKLKLIAKIILFICMIILIALNISALKQIY
jgi:hypothetical protein